MSSNNYLIIPVPERDIYETYEEYVDPNGNTETLTEYNFDFGFDIYYATRNDFLQWMELHPVLYEEDACWYVIWFNNGNNKYDGGYGPHNDKAEALESIIERYETEKRVLQREHKRSQTRTKQRNKRRTQMEQLATQITQQYHNQEWTHQAYYRDTDHKNKKTLTLSPDGLEDPNTNPVAVLEFPKIKTTRPLIIIQNNTYSLYGYKGDKPLHDGSLRLPRAMMIPLNITTHHQLVDSQNNPITLGELHDIEGPLANLPIISTNRQQIQDVINETKDYFHDETKAWKITQS